MLLSNNLTIFKSYIECNNKIIGDIKIENLLKQNIEIPNEQRLRDKDKIKEIVEYQDTFYKNGNNYFNYQGNLNINCCEEKNINYLVDGQHRYFSMKDLCENHGYKNEYVTIELVIVKTFDDVKNNYELINKNTPLPKFPDDIDKNIPEKIAEYFFETYPKAWSSSTRPTRPYLNKNHFQEAIGYLVSSLKNNTQNKNIVVNVSTVKLLIENKNKTMKKWKVDKIPNFHKLKNPDKLLEKCKEIGLFLGLFIHKSDDAGYSWIKEIISDYTGNNDSIKIINKTKKYKKKIPKSVKDATWEKYIGNFNKAYCYCCRVNKISSTEFDCGHVEAEVNGGKTDILNLRPICRKCNNSMKTTNMREFIKKHYNYNLDSFDNLVVPLKRKHIDV